MRTTYVLKQSHIESFRKQKLQDTTYLFGTSIRNFDFAFNPQGLDQKELEIKVFHALKSLDFPILNAIITHPQTIHDLIQCSKELDLYGISLDALPQDTPLNLERYLALKTVDTLISKHHLPQSELVVYPEGLNHAQLTFLKRHHIDLIKPQTQTPKHLRLRSALNLRSEIESCIQDILNQGIEEAIVAIPNLSEHTPLIQSILTRYGINEINDTRSASDTYLSLFSFIHNPSVDTFLQALQYNPFGLMYPQRVIEYITITDMSFEDLYEPFHHIQSHPDYQDHWKLQESIQEDASVINTWMQDFTHLSYKEMHELCYQTLSNHTRLPLSSIKSFLEANLDLYNNETHPFFETHFSSTQSKPQLNGPIQWVDLSDLPQGVLKNLYALNLNAKNYPKIPARTGVIDESYVSSIDAFPSLDARTQFLLSEAKTLLQTSENLTLSYASASYEGKGFELSFVVADYCHQHDVKMQAWPLLELQKKPIVKHRLSESLARQIYLDEGRIKGSISSFQMYREDPYRYFLERGLKASEPLPLSFSAMNMGTLNHSIMQHMNDSSFDAWTDLSSVFPTSNPYFKMIQRRNDVMMKHNLEHIQSALEDTDFSIFKKEHWFEEDHLFPGIYLRGIIDRIDMNDTYSLIVDYKSSAESLSESSVKQMKQLQLLTYALITQRVFGKPILGVFNYAFRSSNLLQSYASYSVSKGVVLSESNPQEMWLKEKRFKGWFFEDPVEHIDSDLFFNGLRVGKNGLAHWGKPYDFEKVETLLKSHYRNLYDFITSGIIDPDDLEIEVDDEFSLKKEDA